MENMKFGIRVLTPEKELYLTQTSIKETEERSFSKKIFLAKDASESDWRLATEDEKNEHTQIKNIEHK